MHPVPATVQPLWLGAVDFDQRAQHNFKPSEPVPALCLGEWVGAETGDPGSSLQILFLPKMVTFFPISFLFTWAWTSYL